MRHRAKSVVRVATIKSLANRFSFLLLLMAAVALMIVGKVDAVIVDQLRTRTTDAVAPLLDALSRPAATVARGVNEIQDLARLREENARLESENAALRQFQAAAYRLSAENRSLRQLMNYEPAPPHSFVTGRVIGDNSGAFVRSLAVHLGYRHGVRDGLAVLGGYGLIGRTVQTGERSTRVLLITDLNARIPVVVEESRHRSILGGDNTDQPRLLYLPPDTKPTIGERVVTSGHGGMFPPGLPIGVVASIRESDVRVTPLEDPSQLEFVRIVDFQSFPEHARLRGHGSLLAK